MATETITGKIFQLKDPTGAYNRFPRTVMEAVYGLNTYLQQQFSSLADIYMPIEGITETLNEQEFVYRKSPATIPAKSLTLDKIKGRTLAWNQLVTNGNFTDGTSGWDSINATISASDGMLRFTPTAASGGAQATNIRMSSDHKYYIAFDVFVEGDTDRSMMLYSGASALITGISVTTNKQRLRYIVNGKNGAYLLFRGSLDTTYVLSNVIVVDLTQMFGADNEPSTVDEFEAMFREAYYPYNEGTLINNDAEAIETVGFNQWDEEWEVGGISPATGQKEASSLVIRSKNYIGVLPSTKYYFYCAANQQNLVYFYDAQYNYIRGQGLANNGIFTTPSNAAFVLFRMATPYGTTYNHDICINLSNPAKNGTYEPYWERVLPLGLDSFQVRDSQGNVITIEGGLKSDRSGKYDEIVGNKFIQRVVRRAYQSGDENDQTVVTDGTNTDYGLATPIEYELVEPLVLTTKAGMTEERISPNADGLSAPMVADMTYDAQANNDSATSQYAARAGRLLNSHKLWGQDFDGTQDVVGALTGVTTIDASGAITAGSFVKSGGTASQFLKADGSVDSNAYYYSGNANKNTVDWTAKGLTLAGAISGATNIDSLLYFDTTNGRVGVGAAPGAYKLDVSGTFRATGNSLIGGTLGVTGATSLSGTLGVSGLASLAGGLKLTTTKKIWFDDTHYIELLNGELHTNLPIVSDSYITAGAAND